MNWLEIDRVNSILSVSLALWTTIGLLKQNRRTYSECKYRYIVEFSRNLARTLDFLAAENYYFTVKLERNTNNNILLQLPIYERSLLPYFDFVITMLHICRSCMSHYSTIKILSLHGGQCKYETNPLASIIKYIMHRRCINLF